jgi:hypothetical protein
MKIKRILIGLSALSMGIFAAILIKPQSSTVEKISTIIGRNELLQQNCPVTEPPEPSFTPPQSYTKELPSSNSFWYGSASLWTQLPTEGTWRDLPYYMKDGGHYFNKVVWWNEDYDWQTEPHPELVVTGYRMDDPAVNFKTSLATNAYTPEYGSVILTGIEIPAPGCWEITGHYKQNQLSFIVWIASHDS